MAAEKQKAAAKKNIKKAQKAWQGMSSNAHSRRQPEGRGREKPGAGGGEYYRIQVRDENQFVSFRTQDVGKKGNIKRLAGRRSNGSWDTQAWLIPKDDAHIEGSRLVPNTSAVREVFEKQFGSEPEHIDGDRFQAKARPNIPEKEKPTAAQKRAQMENIQKAQKARHETVNTGR